MTWIKQSTASTIVIGPLVDQTDGFTAETGLTIAQADIRLSKNGGAFAQTNNAAGATHMENGHYSVPLNTTDTNTLGRLRVVVNESGALPVWRDFMVVPANVWDSFFGADRLQVHVDEMTAGIITATVIATDAIDADAIADNAINAAAIAADAITAAKIADGAIDAATFAAGAINAAAIAADAIGASELAADAVTEIQSGLATAAALATVDTNVDTLVASIVTLSDVSDAIWDETLASHLAAGSTGNALNAAGAAGDPWSTAIPGAYGAGSAGKIIGDNINATISSRATPAQVNTEVDTALADVGLTTTVTGRIDAAITTRATPAQVNTEVDTALADYDAPTFAELDARTDAIDAALVVIDDFLDTEVAAIKAKTDNLPTDPADASDIATSFAALSIPTAAAIRAEMDTNSTKLDVAIGTRLATVGYTAAPSVADILAGVIEGSITLKGALRLALSVLSGRSTGGGTATVIFRDVADTKARVTAAVDNNGNRSVVTRDTTD